jgi:adhesin/invasin
MKRTATFLSLNVVSLTSDVDSQKANNGDVITFTATVKDSAGVAVANTPVTFTTTGSATLSAASVQTDGAGQAVVTLKDGVGESVTVKAVAGINAADNGQTKPVTFVAAKITGVTAYGQTFAPDSGFPQTGLYGAEFQLVIDDDAANASNYTWSVDSGASGWLFVTSPGVLAMRGTPANSATVTITATPTAGGQPLTYTFTLKHWFTSEGTGSADPADADTLCQSRGRELPGYSDFSNGAPGGYGTRAVGTMLGEWGNPSQYPFWSHVGDVEGMWTKDTSASTGQRIYVLWNNFVDEKVLTSASGEVDIVCKAF